MMARTLLALSVSAALAQPALALSCLPPDPASAFADANAAEEVYVVVKGIFSGGPGPRPDGSLNGEARHYGATFTGHTINRDGLAEPISRTATISETCAGPWCSEMQMDTEVLTFLRIEAGSPPHLSVGPCYSNVFFAPTAEQMQAIQQCFETGCTAS